MDILCRLRSNEPTLTHLHLTGTLEERQDLHLCAALSANYTVWSVRVSLSFCGDPPRAHEAEAVLAAMVVNDNIEELTLEGQDSVLDGDGTDTMVQGMVRWFRESSFDRLRPDFLGLLLTKPFGPLESLIVPTEALIGGKGGGKDARNLQAALEANYTLKHLTMSGTNADHMPMLQRNREWPCNLKHLQIVAASYDAVFAVKHLVAPLLLPDMVCRQEFVSKYLCTVEADDDVVEESSIPCTEQPTDELDAGHVSESGEQEDGQQEHGEQDEAKATFNADTARAIVLSKADGAPPLSGDGLVIFKITRNAHSEHTLDAILHSVSLESCRRRVSEAGCEIVPSWGGGAKFLVPFTEEQLTEINAAGRQADVEVRPHHIIALRGDVDDINAAFAEVASKKRPRIDADSDFRFDLPAVVEEAWPSTDSSLFHGSFAALRLSQP